MNCPYCGKNAELKDNSILYGGRSFGLSYICRGYPICDAYVGAHKKSKTPLGTLANAELRALRAQCHSVFDRLWREKHMSRKKAYAFLSRLMKCDEAHIGEFSKERCLCFLLAFRPVEDELIQIELQKIKKGGHYVRRYL